MELMWICAFKLKSIEQWLNLPGFSRLTALLSMRDGKPG